MTTQAQSVLDEIRKTHDTTILSAVQFEELCRAALFYLRGGKSVRTTAMLVIEEVFPVPQEIGRDSETGHLYRMRRA